MEEFDWDEDNEPKVRARMDPAEAEDALRDPDRLSVDAYDQKGERRWAFLGETEAGRLLFVVFTRRSKAIRVITAREATRRETGRLPQTEGIKAMDKAEGEYRAVNDKDEIPTFRSEREEVEFWDRHELGDQLLDRMEAPADDLLPTPRPRAKPISLRIESDILQKLKDLAGEQAVPYQTLLKRFVADGIRTFELARSGAGMGPVTCSDADEHRPPLSAFPRIAESPEVCRHAAAIRQRRGVFVYAE